MRLPFFGKKDKPMETLPAVIENKHDYGEIVVVQKTKGLTTKTYNGSVVQVRKKEVLVNGKKHNIDPQQLMRMIRQVTQTIGEYKRMDNVYGDYAINSMRKARSDMVSDLEKHFNINWQIDEQGNCVFWI